MRYFRFISNFITCSYFAMSFSGTYILPGGTATSKSIAPYEEEAVSRHPYLHDALGDSYTYEVRCVY